jgi:hypothetical protein
VAEAVIRAQRTTSTTPKYQVSQCIRPILSWACLIHSDLVGLRLRLIIILKLESLRRSDDLFNILRSQIVFSNRGVSFRIFQPKEIKGSLGTFGPPIFIPPNTQCCGQRPPLRSIRYLNAFVLSYHGRVLFTRT